MLVHCSSQKNHRPQIYDFDMSSLKVPMAPVIHSLPLANTEDLIIMISSSI